MPARPIRSRTTLVAVIAGSLLLSTERALADKVEMRKLPSYSAFKGFVPPAGAPDGPSWLVLAYDKADWQAEAGKDDWDRLYTIVWKLADGRIVTQELKDNAAGTSATCTLDGFTGNLNCNYLSDDASKSDCQLRVVRDDAAEVDKNTAWVRMANVNLKTVSFDAAVPVARRVKRRAVR